MVVELCDEHVVSRLLARAVEGSLRPNEVAEVTGDGSSMQLRSISTAPPAPPAYWASRDRQVIYDAPQYLSAGVTGYRMAERIEDSLERADQALYEAKRTGKNRTCIG